MGKICKTDFGGFEPLAHIVSQDYCEKFFGFFYVQLLRTCVEVVE